MDTINVKEIIGGTQSEEDVLARNLRNINQEKIGTFRVAKGDNKKFILFIFSKNGNNLLVECNDLEELKQIANKVILNANKNIVDGKQVSIETSLEDKENKRVKINGIINVPFDPEYLKQIQEYDEEICKLYSSEAKDDNEKLEMIFKESDIEEKQRKVEEKGNESAIVVDAKQITMCGETLNTTRDVADYLVNKSNISTNSDKKVIDFNKNNYDIYTQDILLQHMYDKKLKLTKEQASGIRNFKFTSGDINKLLRGKMEKIEENVVLDIINIDKIFRSLPKTKQDIVIYRGGSSTNKSREIESENEWESPISFTTNETIAKGTFGRGGVTYRTVLKAGSPAIPIDTLEKINWYDGSENELILPPLLYKVKDVKNQQKEDRVNLDINILEFKDLISCLENTLKKYQELTHQKLAEVEKSETKLKNMGSVQENATLEYLGYDEKDLQEKQLDIRDVIKNLEEKGEFQDFLERDSKIEEDNLQYQSNLHGTNHTRRVAFFATILSDLGQLDPKDRAVLMTAVQYHDIGRKNDYEDKQHGTSSVKILEENSDRLEDFDKEDQELIKFIIEQHSKNKKENEEAISRLEDDKKERYENLLNYMKDSDKLDRVRLGKYDGLNVSRLSLPMSKKLVKVAYQAHEYLFDILNVKNKDTYLRDTAKIEAYLKLIEKEKNKPIENIEVEDLTYFDDKEEQTQYKENIENETEEKQEYNMKDGLEDNEGQEEKWMNRFKGWYGVIDKVSEKSKRYFIKIKSDIVNSIRRNMREKMYIKKEDRKEKQL